MKLNPKFRGQYLRLGKKIWRLEKSGQNAKISWKMILNNIKITQD